MDNCPNDANADQVDTNGNGVGDACDNVAATSFVEVPNPLSGDNPRYAASAAAVPAPGQSVSDAPFGTAQRRVVRTEGLRHEYSRFDPFNRDQSMILLTHLPSGEWRVYRTQTIPYDQDANFVRTVELAELRWDPLDANLLWGLQGFWRG